MQPVFVGDIQGCGEEFTELVGLLEGRFGEDFELFLVGDLINRGPRNLQVLETARSFVEGGRGTVVLGNHEIALLEVAFGLREPGPFDTSHELLAEPDAREWVEWLRLLPIAHVGDLAGTGYAMVHAAVHPAWTLGDVRAHAATVEAALHAGPAQARDFLENRRTSAEGALLGRFVSCRSVGFGEAWYPAEPTAETRPWHEPWSEHGHDYGVVYGHWAWQGLHVAQGLRGLDTGCVHHGRGRETALTAWLPAPDDVNAFTTMNPPLLEVPAKRRYYPKD